MSAFFQALEELKKRKPMIKRAVENIFIDRCSPANPFGISPQLEKSLDLAVSNGQAVEEAIHDHTVVKQPDLHTEAEVAADKIKRVLSIDSFNRWHRGNGNITASYSDASDKAWEELKDILEDITEPGEGGLKKNIEAR